MNDGFELAVEKVFKLEGGYVNHPNDPGGPTNFGLSQRFLRTIRHPKAEVVQTITKLEAAEVYRREFWDRYRVASVPSQALREKLFTTAIWIGPEPAIERLQAAVCAVLGDFHACAQDGVIGPRTLALIQAALPEDRLLPAYSSEIAGQIRVLIARNDGVRVFREGWLERAYAR